jgi:23S rRNA pseudouridine2604 synthase
MCEFLNYEVVKLKRVRIMNIQLDTEIGQWRYLTDEEMTGLNELISESSKTDK